MPTNKKTPKIICITGTHHTPAVELIKQLQNDPETEWKIEYIGHLFPSENHILHTIIPKLKVNFHQIEGGKLDRRYLPNTLMGIPKTIRAIFTSIKLLRNIKPNIVVSFGGYISVPVIIAGFLNRIPTITHEQTLTISLSTKINSFFVNKIALSFPESAGKSSLPANKTIVTGNLLRNDIFKTKSPKYSNLNKLLLSFPLIYITGGNQGSSPINNTADKIIDILLKKYIIIHHTGKLDYQLFKNKYKGLSNYLPTEFVDIEDIGWVLNNASIIISRSGANICQEIVALNKRSILIPLPVSQQNEQLLNARWTKNNLPGKTIIIPQVKLTPEKMLKSISKLIRITTDIVTNQITPNKKLLNLIYETIS